MDHIEADIRKGGIKDERIIEAALQVPPGNFRPWEILPRPAVVAGIAEALQPTSDSKVLDIGTGTGYLAAVLAVLSDRVVTLEISETFAAYARRSLEDSPFGHKVIVIQGDGSAGYPQEAPYDCISVHGCLREVPNELREQLVDGGRLLLCVGSKDQQELQLITREGESFSTRVLGKGGFSPLKGRYGTKKV